MNLLKLLIVCVLVAIPVVSALAAERVPVPSVNKMGAEVVNYNRLRPHIATGGRIDLEHVSVLRNLGFRTIVDLRTAAEGTADEQVAVEAQGLVYVNLPVGKGAPSKALIDQLGEILNDPASGPILLHCASGNRVGAAWAIYRVRNGAPLDIALQEGRSAGMRASRERQVRELLAKDFAEKGSQ